jgi:hypothetical protein
MERESEQSLTQHSVSEHDSDSEPEATPSNNDIGPRFLTQRSVVYLDSDSEPENSTPDSPPPPPLPSTNDIGSQVMESRPNSTRVPLQSFTHMLDLPPNALTEAGFFFTGMIQYFN